MLKILLVDDEASEREGMKFLIEKYQYPLQIVEAVNGKNALAYVKEHMVDIVLTDIKMPFMDGLELAEEIANIKPETKIIIFSAYGEFSYAQKAMRARAVSYLLKPIEVDEFTKVMTEVIAKCKKEKEEKDLDKKMRSVDKQMLLYQLLSGKALEEDILDGLKRHGIQKAGNYMQVLHLESQNSLFADKEEMFLKFVDMYAPCAYEYSNRYPNEAGIIFFSDTKLMKSDIERFAEKLIADIQKFAKEVLFVIAGNPVLEMKELTQEVNSIREMRNSLFGCDSGIVFTQEMENFNEFYGKEILVWKKKLELSIDEKIPENVEINIDYLISCISKAKGLSIVYMHYIFYDLLNKLYTSFGIYDEMTISKRIEEVVKCRTYEDLSKIFEKILKEIKKGSGENTKGHNSMIGKIIRIIHKEYANELSLEYIAEAVNVVPSYLSYVFKKETGDTLIKYITDFRMNKAKELLEEGSLKIAQIAKICGYENPSYFNKLFKEYFEVTPKQYREGRNAEK